ncbi:DHA2 family efflux MFS transporter permease subunit [Nocardioides sp.]|uniref:DHA2 family efflux MFS transporter permease subunit n=1 Tax=Nocardioides sp. TaxID=35761 RepID=UPI003514A435
MTTTSSAPEPILGSTAAEPAPDYGLLRWLVLATFIVILNETVMANALPRLTIEFGIAETTAQWLTSGFLLTMAVVIPVTGWFLQRVTTRQAFTTAMSTFCAGTLLAALAPTFEILLAARIVQAMGTAVMMPLLMTTLMTLVREQDRGRVMGNVTLAMSVAPALGPAVSGVVLHVASWRWMFGLVLPLAVLATVAGLRRLTNVGQTTAGSIDWLSVAMSALGFGPFVYGLSQLGGDAVPAGVTYGAIAFGTAVLVAFVLRQRALQRTEAAGRGPLLDLRTLTHRTYALGLVLMAVAFMALLGSLLLLPLYLQNVRDLSELQSGLLVMPGGLAMGLMGPQVGKVYDRVGARPLVIPGAVVILAALLGFTRVGLDTPMAVLIGMHLALMIGLAAVFTPVFTIALGSLPPQLYSHGSSLLGALQQVAGAAGAALVIAVSSARAESLVADGVAGLDAAVGGMRWGFGIGAVAGLIMLAVALVLPSRADGEGAAASEAPAAAH